MPTFQKMTTCLWFDNQAEEAANYYVSVFEKSKITHISRYGEAGTEIHGRKPGSVMAVTFEIDGHEFTALNGGPLFKLSEAVSFQVHCQTQDEVDYFWEKLREGGDEQAQQCGWLKDKFGLSWQVFPAALLEMLNDPDYEKSQRVMAAMLQMKKIDLEKLRQAYAG